MTTTRGDDAIARQLSSIVAQTESDIDVRIREVVASRGHLDVDALEDTDDLFLAGMTPLANVSVMLALESTLGITFPERMLRRSTFESIAAIRRAVDELGPGETV